MQFDRVEPLRPAVVGVDPCVACKNPLQDNYYLAGVSKICASCHAAVQAELAKGSKVGRFFRATVFGTVAAILGALAYIVWVKLTNIHFGLVAIFIGIGVSVAVKKGSDGRGGWVYQGLAMLLTYLSIVGMFVPEIAGEVGKMLQKSQEERINKEAAASGAAPSGASAESASGSVSTKPTAGGCVLGILALLALTLFVLALAMATPFITAAQQPFFLLIIGFAVYEAWKINRRPSLKGPYRIAGVAPGSGAGG